jgi:sterol 3beta-glucosyltransferase
VTGCGLGFRLVPGDPELLGASEQGQRWQEGGTGAMSGIRFIRLIAQHTRDVNAAILQAARQDTDVLLVAGTAWFGGYRIAQGLGLPSIGLALQPTHPTSQFPPSGLTTRSLGRWGNRALGRALVVAGPAAIDKPSKPLWAREGMPGLSTRQLYRRQEATRWPFIYGYSPSVVPRPPDWREGIEVAGYWWPPTRPAGRRPRTWSGSSRPGRRRCSSGSAAGTPPTRPASPGSWPPPAARPGCGWSSRPDGRASARPCRTMTT